MTFYTVVDLLPHLVRRVAAGSVSPNGRRRIGERTFEFETAVPKSRWAAPSSAEVVSSPRWAARSLEEALSDSRWAAPKLARATPDPRWAALPWKRRPQVRRWGSSKLAKSIPDPRWVDLAWRRRLQTRRWAVPSWRRPFQARDRQVYLGESGTRFEMGQIRIGNRRSKVRIGVSERVKACSQVEAGIFRLVTTRLACTAYPITSTCLPWSESSRRRFGLGGGGDAV
jgi:hypothetical protein